jgi:FdrA protein
VTSLASVLDQTPRVVNIGLEVFAAELEVAGATVIHVDWRPPAGGPAVAALLARLDDAS